ncbi:MAG: tyrosine--tRNA ligase [Candidatus Tectomicrobia bacterium]|uniref:Tyrosine--tRNA ligase n=1 Tax=Tectimicrobiota bacterium TaxID=2528274 RepID=A0A932M1D5_UNCTE|nr:tyrosine--tRNA ligase [Candidatus Tectomicrobia bacterium]
MSPEEQLRFLKRGAVEIIQEEELLEKLRCSRQSGEPLRVKLGMDPTAPDLHSGHTVVLQKLKHFQTLGHQVIFLIGDFTGMIGDPSGKSETRPPLSPEEIQANAKTYQDQIFKILDSQKTRIELNSRWLGNLSARDLILMSARFTVAQMLEREDFHTRYTGQLPIAIHEFLYPLLQAYDSVSLKADVELGGTDQKFNLLMGRDLQRAFEQPAQVIITMPILEGIDGVQKMSKSLGNYIGISEPPGEMYGKLMSISDDLMWRYYDLLSDQGMEELHLLKSRVERQEVNPRDIKADLAAEIVSRFHGAEAAATARDNFDRLFRYREVPAEVPELRLLWDGDKMWLPRLMTKAGLASSTSEAIRLIEQGGVSLDGEKVREANLELLPGKSYLLRVGKRRFLRVIPVTS